MKKLWCLFIALALNAAFTFAQSLVPVQPEVPFIEPPWLQINCHNPAKNQKLKPQWTVIVTSVKPSIKQIGINRWEISFH
jgi:hypothetical protein